MIDIAGLAVAGLITATVLFMTASGLTLIFGVSRILNLAHGSFVMFGAYLAFQVTSWVEGPTGFWFALIAVPIGVGFTGVLVEVTMMRWAYRGDLLTQMLVTVAALFVLADVVRLIWGTRHRSVPIPEPLRGTISVWGSHFPVYHVATIVGGGLILIALLVLINRTRWGLFIRACAQNRKMAAALGINDRMVLTTVFGLGTLLAGAAGVLAAPLVSANDGLAVEYLILALVVVVVGGMGSVAGSLIASLLIGLVRSYGTILLPEFELVFVFATMAIVLVVRPRGLLGRFEQ